jgi:hypothetical protein
LYQSAEEDRLPAWAQREHVVDAVRAEVGVRRAEVVKEDGLVDCSDTTTSVPAA